MGAEPRRSEEREEAGAISNIFNLFGLIPDIHVEKNAFRISQKGEKNLLNKPGE